MSGLRTRAEIGTPTLVYVLMIFPKALANVECAKHLMLFFGTNRLVKFVDLKTLKQPPLGNWPTMRAQLNISSRMP